MTRRIGRVGSSRASAALDGVGASADARASAIEASGP
jgi:hypothetical protein